VAGGEADVLAARLPAFAGTGPVFLRRLSFRLRPVLDRTHVFTWYAFDQWTGEAKYIEVAEHVRSATPENSVVMAWNDSGNIRYFGGRVTLRWDILQEDWLDRSVVWMASEACTPTCCCSVTWNGNT